jgi:hypothetical protein
MAHPSPKKCPHSTFSLLRPTVTAGYRTSDASAPLRKTGTTLPECTAVSRTLPLPCLMSHGTVPQASHADLRPRPSQSMMSTTEDSGARLRRVVLQNRCFESLGPGATGSRLVRAPSPRENSAVQRRDENLSRFVKDPDCPAPATPKPWGPHQRGITVCDR